MAESMRERVERLLRTPGDEAALEELRRLAPEFRRELLEAPIEPAEDPGPELLEWVARVYKAIGEALESPVPDSVPTADPSELSDVGKAFSTVLVADLPEAWTRFEDLFGTADAEVTRRLRRREDVLAAGEWGAKLARAGLAPLTFHLATEAVSGLIDRLMRHEEPARSPIGLSLTGDPLATDAAIDRELLVDEIAAVAECSETVAGAMLRWLVQVAHHRPLLFRHFVARPVAAGVELQHLVFVLGASQVPPTASTPDNLLQRWGLALEKADGWLKPLGVTQPLSSALGLAEPTRP